MLSKEVLQGLKPVVLFDSYKYIREGKPAILVGVRNHPNPNVKGDGLVETSTVERIIERDPDGTIIRFETRNTVYINDSET